MYIIDIFFTHNQTQQNEQQMLLLNQLIDQWRYNGQIIGREIPLFLAEQEQSNGFGIRVICPEQHSLLFDNNNQPVQDCLAKLQKCGVNLESFQIVAEDFNSDQTNEDQIDWQVLYTTHLQSCSPLHNGENLAPIPLYKSLKNQPHLSMDLIKWQENWQACDQLQMNGSTLEQQALLEISNVDSHLFKHGYALAKEVEQQTGTPTYYYLYRVGAKDYEQEQQRRCPICQGKWTLSTPILDIFHFKCDTCRLVSNISWNCL
ncbi:Zn-ribbon-containing protein [Pasteurellaceae bacterium 22721_9_1]